MSIVFETNKKELLDVLSKLKRITTDDPYIITSNVKVEVLENISFTTNNVESQITEWLFDDVSRFPSSMPNAVVYVNFDQLYNIAYKSKKDTKFSFHLEHEKELRIYTDRTRYALPHFTLADDEFYSTNYNDWITDATPVFTTSIHNILHAINKIDFACAKADEFRDEYKGICFDTKDGNLVLTATNTRTMANIRVFDTDIVTQDVEFILDKKDLLLLKKSFDYKKPVDLGQEMIDVYIEPHDYKIQDHSGQSSYRKVYITHRNGCIMLSNIDRRFPAWRKLVYGETRENNFVFDVQSMRESVTQLSALKMDREYPVLGITAKDNEGLAKTIYKNGTNAISSFEVRDVNTDDEMFICFNHDILKECLDKIDEKCGIMFYNKNNESVVVKCYSPDGQCSIHANCDDELDYQYLIMPVRPDSYENLMET